MHNDAMRFVKDIFDAFGGNGQIAEITGEKYPTVSSWLLRCSIPPKHWGALVEAAKSRGIALTFETLVSVSQNKKAERALRAGDDERDVPEPASEGQHA